MSAPCFARGQGTPRPRAFNSAATALPPAEVLELLASMLLFKPTRDALLGWRAVLTERATGLLAELIDALGRIDVDSPQEIEGLLWEYTRLFIGPYRLPCPPWESVYTSPKRLLMQEAYDAVRAMHRQAGLEVGDPSVLADHVGAELQFLALLIERVGTDVGDNRSYRQLAVRFLREHIRNWIPRFSADLEQATEVPFYKSLAWAIRRVVCSKI